MSAIVTTRSGKVEGNEEPGLKVFKGIPYAAPPTGALRWMPPAKAEAWSGTRATRAFGSAAPQPMLPAGVLEGMNVTDPQSEDCLYLNVWTPGTDNRRRPVLVWIHGGAFQIGSGSQSLYDGASLARRGDAVVVTINYRLGPLGFLRLADVTNGRIPSTGTEGILDQVAALEWVRDNIAEFGGDPDNVTIFGESAGGMSVGTLLGLPAARGLFHKAIPQSGACHTAASPARASDVAARLLRKTGCSLTDTDGLRALTVEQLLQMGPSAAAPDPEIDGLAFLPVVDGSSLPRRAYETVVAGESRAVDVLVGSTSEEWKLFLPMDPNSYSLDDARLEQRLQRRMDQGPARSLIAAYRTALAERGEATSATDLFAAIETDRMFGIPAVKLAQAQSAHQPKVFRYLFTWKSPLMGGMFGACHALELGFVFGTHAAPGLAAFCGAGPEADALAGAMQDTWLAFARSGDPSCDAIGVWPAFEKTRSATMIFGEKRQVENAPFERERRAWDGVSDDALGK